MQDYERTLYRTLSEEPASSGFRSFSGRPAIPMPIKLFQERLDFIVKAYKRRRNADQPWNTDRGRIYILNGPGRRRHRPEHGLGGRSLQGAATGAWAVDRNNEDVQAFRTEIWTYSVRSQYAKYVFVFRAPNESGLSAAAVENNQFISLLENYNKTVDDSGLYGRPNTNPGRSRKEKK